MRLDQTTSTTPVNSNEPGTANQTADQPLGYIRRAVRALTHKTQQALSPWIRRRLQARATATPPRRPPSVTTRNTRQLLHRVHDRTERAVVWKPNIGSLKPALVQQFTNDVTQHVNALHLVSVRRNATPSRATWDDDIEMPLPVGTPGAETARSSDVIRGPSIFSMGQAIEPFVPKAPAATRPQRATPASRPTRSRQHQPPALGARRFTRVEEMPADSEPPVPALSPVQEAQPPEAITRETPAPRPEELAIQPEPRPVVPPVVQTAEPAGITGGPRSRVTATPRIQRQVAPGAPPPRRTRPATGNRAPQRAVEPPAAVIPSPPAETSVEAIAPETPTGEPPGLDAPVASPSEPTAPQTPPAPVAHVRQARPTRIAPTVTGRRDDTRRQTPPPANRQRPGRPEPSPAAQRQIEAQPQAQPVDVTPAEPATAETSTGIPKQAAPPQGQQAAASETPVRRAAEPGTPAPSQPRPAHTVAVRPSGEPSVARPVTAVPVRAQAPREEPPTATAPSPVVPPHAIPAPAPSVRRDQSAAPVTPPQTLQRAAEARTRPQAAPAKVERDSGTPLPVTGVEAWPQQVNAPELDQAATPEPFPLLRALQTRAAARTHGLARKPESPATRYIARMRPRATAGKRRDRVRLSVPPELPEVTGPRHRATAHRDIAARRETFRDAPTLYARSPDLLIGPGPAPAVSHPRLRSQKRPASAEQSSAPMDLNTALGALHGYTPSPSQPAARPGPGRRVVTTPQPPRAAPKALPSSPPGPPETEREMPVVLPQTPQPREEIRQSEPETVEAVAEAPPAIMGTLVQREAGDEDEGEINEAVDIADLARRVYPLVKRLIAVERERMPGRLP